MKTKLLCIFATVFVVACSDSRLSPPSLSPQTPIITSYKLEIGDVEDKVSVFVEDMSLKTKNSSIKDVAIIMRSDIDQTTRSAVCDTVMYAVNFENDNGFVLLSTDKRVPVLAMVEEGNFYGQTDNPGLQMFLELSMDYVEAVVRDHELMIDSLSSANFAKQSTFRPETKTQIKEYETWIEDDIKPSTSSKPYPDAVFKGRVVVGWGPSYSSGVKPVLKTAWDQSSSPYNSLFPLCSGATSDRHDAGCTNVAIAQIMSHFEIPKTIPDPREPRISRTLNWAEMKANPHAPNLSFIGKECISYLLRGVSIVFNSKTSCNGTATAATIIENKMRSTWRYTMDPLQTYDLTKVKNSINLGRPVFIRGDRYPNVSGGHAWVLDGYKHYIAHNERFEVWSTGYTQTGEVWISTSLRATRSVDYLYCNWGWGPFYSRNGYYLSGVWDMGYRPSEANPTRGDYHYRYNVQTINNIKY